MSNPISPCCNASTSYYDGALGYSSFTCDQCGKDVADAGNSALLQTMTVPGFVADWHKPSNDACMNNANPAADCTCVPTAFDLLKAKGRTKKKVRSRVIFRCTDSTVDRGIKSELVVELHDDGKLTIRESKRRQGYETTVGRLYSRLMKNHALQVAGERARARAAARKSAKQSKKLAARLARDCKSASVARKGNRQ